MRPAELLATRFPDAVGGLLAGSLARGEGTTTSDVDLLVLLGGRPAPMRRTERLDGRLVEFFVHTEESFHAFVDREVPLGRSPLLHMAAHGVIVLDHDGRVARLREVARSRWDAGPTRLDGAALEDRRYRLTGLLDDLADEEDGAVAAALATTVFLDVADLALALRGRWSGRGRRLARRLREADEALTEALVAGLGTALAGDTAELVACGRGELDRAGGPLDDGYVRHARAGTWRGPGGRGTPPGAR